MRRAQDLAFSDPPEPSFAEGDEAPAPNAAPAVTRFRWADRHWAALVVLARDGDRSAEQLAVELNRSDDFRGAIVSAEGVQRQLKMLRARGLDLPEIELRRKGPDIAALRALLAPAAES